MTDCMDMQSVYNELILRPRIDLTFQLCSWRLLSFRAVPLVLS
jgi:hypothetical protein